MRIAVLSDIHGNLRALEAVLGDLRRQAPDLKVHRRAESVRPLELDPPATGDEGAVP